MVKFLFAADLHFRGTNPRNRIDNYKEAAKLKLKETFQIAEEKAVDAIIWPGDVFDSFNVSIGVLLELADFITSNKPKHIPILTTYGQHDVQGYNKESLYRTSLALLERLIPELRLYTDPSQRDIFVDNNGTKVQLTFTPYSRQMDVDGYGYSPEDVQAGTSYSIHVAHGTLLDHKPPFDKFTLLKDVQTKADLVLTGDYHPGYGIFKRGDGKVFCNPGSLTRLSATENSINRKIKVALVEVQGSEANIELIQLENQRPGEEVLDRSKIEAEKERQYNMENFAALIEAKTGEAVLLDVNQIVDEIAAQEGTEKEVVQLALDKIDEARGELKQ